MSNVWTRPQNPAFLLDLLEGVKTNYNVYPFELLDIYTLKNSDQAYEVLAEAAGLPEARIAGEGKEFYEGPPGGQRWITQVNHLKYTIKFSMSLELIEDNRYASEWPRDAEMMRASMTQAKNKSGAILFNNAFNYLSRLGDGKPMCSLNHPLDVGTYANTFDVGVQMNEIALNEMSTMASGFQSASNLNITVKLRFLYVPIPLRYQASRLLNSRFQPESGNNAINTVNFNDYLPEGYKESVFLTYDNVYFGITDEKDGFIHYRRTPMEYAYDSSPSAGIFTATAYERWSNVCWSARAVIGAGTGIEAN